jgi:hypothetical protein
MSYPAPRLYLRSPNSADQLGESVLYDLDPYSSVIDSEFLAYSGEVISLGSTAIKQHVLVPGNTTPGSTTTNPVYTTPGSTIFYLIARGEWATGSPTAPTDNLGNSISLASGPNPYSGFPTSDSAIYISTNNVGGNNHTATVAWGSFSGTAQDEATIALIETIGANTIQTQSFIERSGAGTVSSLPVTTTTPTLLLAVVMGTGNTGQLHTFNSTTGFTKITQASAEGDPDPNGYIQASVFYKYAPVAGTYTASFTTTASEGAQIYLLALQNVAHGILSQGIGGPGLSATGTVPLPGITGTLNQTLGVLTDTATGTITVTGSAAPSLGSLVDTSAATVKVTGSATPSLGSLVDTSAGTVGDTAALSQTLGTLTSVASGTVSDAANASITLGSLTSTAIGAISDTASLGVTLGTLGISATGTTTNTITGTLAVSMGALTDSSTGAVSIAGTSAPSLGALADTATGTIAIHSALSQSLGSIYLIQLPEPSK